MKLKMASEGELGHPEGYEIVDFSSREHYSSVYLWHSGKFQWFQFWHSVDQNVTFYIRISAFSYNTLNDFQHPSAQLDHILKPAR